MKKFKNIAIIAVAMVLVFALGVGATLAYFVSESKLVVNTFTPTKFGKPEVTETDPDREFFAIPGVAIDKDPRVKYTPGTDTADQQAEAYLYLTIQLAGGWTASTDAYTFTKTVGTAGGKLEFTLVRSNWSYLGKTDGGVLVYAYIVGGNEKKLKDSVGDIEVITDDKVSVSESITKEDVADLDYKLGSVTFGAYAVQAKFDENKTAKEAWNLVNTSIQITKK
jgi:hypothetical protein